jgi:hypothetical protein
MKVRWLALWFVALTGTSLPVALLGHHSVSVEFDENRRIPLTGTVTKVEWQNPHTFFYIDVRDPKTGMVNNWACELGSPNTKSTHLDLEWQLHLYL